MFLILWFLTICVVNLTSGTTPINPEDDDLWPSHQECAHNLITHRIAEGDKTELGEYPFAVLLNSAEEFTCGGSLINHWYVLTAAHCMGRKPDFVRLGEWKISSEKDCETVDENRCSDPVKDVRIEKIIIHKNYDPLTYDNDIALIQLKKRVEYTQWIRPVCLPRSNEHLQKVLVGETIKIMGWGTVTESPSSTSDTLLKADVEIYKNNDCYLRLGVIVEASQYCAGSQDGRASCKGDSGGPAVILTGSEPYYLQVGLVSAGPVTCGQQGIPQIYTHIISIMGWINENVETAERHRKERLAENWPSKEQCKSNWVFSSESHKQDIKLGEFPFMTIVSTQGGHTFGGALLNHRYVLTCFRCTRDVTTIRLGDWKLDSERDCENENRCSDPSKEVTVEEMIIHPKYNRHTKENDIALLRLAERVEFTEWIRPICLPDVETQMSDPNERFLVIGEEYSPLLRQHSTILQKAELKVKERSVCNEIYNVELSESFLCMGMDNGTDPCVGFTGSPVVKQSTAPTLGKYNTLVGIVWGGTCEEGSPGVYVNIALYKNWIEENIAH